MQELQGANILIASIYRFYRRVKHSTLQLLLFPMVVHVCVWFLFSVLYHKTLGLIFNFMGL